MNASQEKFDKTEETDYKQVIVIRKELGMRKGKIAAQAAHASMAVFLRAPEAVFRDVNGQKELVIALDEPSHAWLTGRFRKICLSVNSEAELVELYRKASEAGLRCALIRDSGLTEFKGVPTLTALAIGPHSNEEINPLTRHLPLL